MYFAVTGLDVTDMIPARVLPTRLLGTRARLDDALLTLHQMPVLMVHSAPVALFQRGFEERRQLCVSRLASPIQLHAWKSLLMQWSTICDCLSDRWWAVDHIQR